MLQFKLVAAILAITTTVYASGGATCLYCKHQDTTAGMLYNYGYCPNTNKCYVDVWNHMNAWCDTAWIDGYSLDLQEDCLAVNAGAANCLNFVSSTEYAAKNLTGTKSLAEGQFCTISVDATGY